MSGSAPEDPPPGATARRRAGLRAAAVFVLLLLAPAGLYIFYVVGQLDQIRSHNLQRLDYAAQSITAVLANAGRNFGFLSATTADTDRWDDPCAFFLRQPLLDLSKPENCNDLKHYAGYTATPPAWRVAAQGLQLHSTWSRPLSTAAAAAKPPAAASGSGAADGDVRVAGASVAPLAERLSDEQEIVVTVRLDRLMQQIPFGQAFDRVMIIDTQGRLVGPQIIPQKPSVMQPPGTGVTAVPAPVNVLRLKGLALPAGADQAPKMLQELASATVIYQPTIAGRRFDLVCQPFWPGRGGVAVTARAGAPDADDAALGNWQLCGLVDSRQAFRQALTVAPYVSVTLLVLLTLGIVSWPILKFASLSRHERVKFSDFYLLLLATLALTMLVTVAIVDIGTHLKLRQLSYGRLQQTAAAVSERLQREIDAMYRQLRAYDTLVADAPTATVFELARRAPRASVSITELLLPLAQRSGAAAPASALGRTFPPPAIYPALSSIFWMRPCDGQQFIKATPRLQNTPAVPLAERAYFQRVRTGQLWTTHLPESGAVRLFADTSASITTGEFFAAVSSQSRLQHDTGALFPAPGTATPAAWRDCQPPENRRFAVALIGNLENLQHPVLAPGVGFAVIDSEGRVMVHSDSRRSVYDNLFQDPGIAARLRAVVAADASARIYAQYQTRPHQLYVTPVKNLPWFVVTFVDDEVLRTLHIETIVTALYYIGLYWLFFLLFTLVYLLVRGRNPPHWVWPRPQDAFRGLYLSTLQVLALQLAVFLVTLSLLQGWLLLLASALLPLPAVLTVASATAKADRLQENTGKLFGLATSRYCWPLASALLALSLVIGMYTSDEVAARLLRWDGTLNAALAFAALVLLAASGRFPQRLRAVLRWLLPARWFRRLRDRLSPHIACSVLVWLLAGALPAYGFFKFAWQEESVRWMQLEQAYVHRALHWRDCAWASEDRQIPVPAGTGRRDLMAVALDAGSFHQRARQTSIYPQAVVLQQRLEVTRSTQAAVLDRSATGLLKGSRRLLSRYAPVYNETTTYARYIAHPRHPSADAREAVSPGHWVWQAGEIGVALGYRGDSTGECSEDSVYITGEPALLEPVLGGWGWLLGVPAGLWLLSALASFSTRKLFFGEIEEEASPAGGRSAGAAARLAESALRDPPTRQWVAREVAYLRETGLDIAAQSMAQWCRDCSTCRSVVDRILTLATPLYERLWRDLHTDEQLLLHQMAQERFANPRQTDAVRHLLRRGLLQRDPVLRIMNRSFALFVQTKIPAARVRALEADGLSWRKLRGAMLTALIPLLLFLSFTQRDMVEIWIAYLGTAAAGSAGILKLLGLLNRSGEEKLGD